MKIFLFLIFVFSQSFFSQKVGSTNTKDSYIIRDTINLNSEFYSNAVLKNDTVSYFNVKDPTVVIKLKFYSLNDTALIKTLWNNTEIKGAYIAGIYFADSDRTMGKIKKYFIIDSTVKIPFPLKFSDCYIDSLYLGKCDFLSYINILNCTVNNVNIWRSSFSESFRIDYSSIINSSFYESTFNKYFELITDRFNDTNSSFIEILGCYFKSYAKFDFDEFDYGKIENSMFDTVVNFSTANEKREKSDPLFYRAISNFSFDKTTFNREVHFSDLDINRCTFYNTKFYYWADLRRIRFLNIASEDENLSHNDTIFNLSKSYFIKNCRISLDLGDDITTLNLGLSNLSRVEIWYPEVAECIDEEDIELIEQQFNFYKDYVNNINTSNTHLKTKVVSWLHYQQLGYMKRFLGNHPGFCNAFKSLGLSFRQLFYNYGYEGEIRFFLSVLFFTLIYSLIYLKRGYKTQIEAFLNSIQHSKDSFSSKFQVVKYKNNIRNFLRCYWFSVVLFLSPKYSKEYLNLQFGLFLFTVSEWIVGKILIVFFIIYIALDYPFIKVLFGI